jgi:RinA family phage transcriptional activator
LKRVERLEVDAVRAAIKQTLQKEDGRQRMKLIRHIYWTHEKKTMSGVALELYISRATAFRWASEFIMLVAECFGIYDPE